MLQLLSVLMKDDRKSIIGEYNVCAGSVVVIDAESKMESMTRIQISAYSVVFRFE